MRKPRYPKGFDPNNPGPKPDPERWMPKWQRSGQKKGRRRRRDEKEIKGSQVSSCGIGKLLIEVIVLFGSHNPSAIRVLGK